MRKLLDETRWIEREFYDLPFFKRLTVLENLEILKLRIRELLQKIARLETENPLQ